MSYNNLTTNNLTVNNVTQSGTVNIGGTLTTTSTVINTLSGNATSATTGAVQVQNGGIGVQGDSYFNGKVKVNNAVNTVTVNASNLQNAYVNATDNNTWTGRNALSVYAAQTVSGGTTTCTNCTAIGFNALKNTTTSNNTAMGFQALSSNTTGANNTANGVNALQSVASGNTNTAIGYGAGSLQVQGNNNTFVGATTTQDTGSNTYNNSTALGYGATITGSNQIVIGTASETVYMRNNLNVTGTVLASNFPGTSDSRLKTNIQPIETACLPVIEALRPSTFVWKETQQADYGFVAQEFHDAVPFSCPRFVTSDGFETIEYSKVVVLLTKALQEVNLEVKELREQVNQLREKVK